MNTKRFMIVLTAINLLCVIFVLSYGGSALAGPEKRVLRGEAIELLDEQGKVRAQLDVEPGGEAVFRMRDANGTIRVKMGASEDGSALLLLNNETEPSVHMLAKSSGTTLTLTDREGKRVIEP
jgi:hypothetical protein